MTEDTRNIFRGIASGITGTIFFCISIGLCILMLSLFAQRAAAEERFIGFGMDVDHNKKRSSLCYSGGISRNLTYTAKAMAGIESGDIRYYFFYKNEKCVLNGDIKDNDRAYFVDGREESIGFSFEWRTHF